MPTRLGVPRPTIRIFSAAAAVILDAPMPVTG